MSEWYPPISAPKSIFTMSPRPSAAVARAVVRLGGALAERHDRVERQTASAPSRRMVVSMSSAVARSVTPRTSLPVISSNALVGDGLGLARERDLSGSFTQRSRSTSPDDGINSIPAAFRSVYVRYVSAVRLEGHPVNPEGRAAATTAGTSESLRRRACEVGDLVGRLSVVPAVGEERAALGREDERAVRTGEARRGTGRWEGDVTRNASAPSSGSRSVRRSTGRRIVHGPDDTGPARRASEHVAPRSCSGPERHPSPEAVWRTFVPRLPRLAEGERMVAVQEVRRSSLSPTAG